MAQSPLPTGSPFEALRRRAAAIQSAVARGEHRDAIAPLVRPVGPVVAGLHRAGHDVVARRFGLPEPASEPSGQSACAGLGRLARARAITPEHLAVFCAGQAAECLGLGIRFQRKVWLSPDLKLALTVLRRRGVADPEGAIEGGWFLARRLLRAQVDDLASALAEPLRALEGS